MLRPTASVWIHIHTGGQRMRFSVWRVTYVLSALLSFSVESFSGETNVIGDDSRVAMKFSNKTKLPFSAIGMLENGEGAQCTASLIGQDLIITAAHCVYTEKNVLSWPMTFHLQYNQGAQADEANATQVWTGTKKIYAGNGNYSDTVNDWAILRISKKLGKTYGWLGTRALKWGEWEDMDGWFMLPGYSTDYDDKLGVALHCSIQTEFSHYLHDCDSRAGSSGGPILTNFGKESGGWQIVAINAFERGDNKTPESFNFFTANGAVKGSYFVPTVKKLLGIK